MVSIVDREGERGTDEEQPFWEEAFVWWEVGGYGCEEGHVCASRAGWIGIACGERSVR